MSDSDLSCEEAGGAGKAHSSPDAAQSTARTVRAASAPAASLLPPDEADGWREAHTAWTAFAAPFSGPRRSGFLALEVPVAVAVAIIEALRRARVRGDAGLSPLQFTGRQAQVGLLFAAARSMKLSGMKRESFLWLAQIFWDISADEAGAGKGA